MSGHRTQVWTRVVILFWVILEISGMVPHLENWVTAGVLFKDAFHFRPLLLISFSLYPCELWSLCNRLQTLWYSDSPRGSMRASKVNDRIFWVQGSKSIIPLCKMFVLCFADSSRRPVHCLRSLLAIPLNFLLVHLQTFCILSLNDDQIFKDLSKAAINPKCLDNARGEVCDSRNTSNFTFHDPVLMTTPSPPLHVSMSCGWEIYKVEKNMTHCYLFCQRINYEWFYKWDGIWNYSASPSNSLWRKKEWRRRRLAGGIPKSDISMDIGRTA